MFCGVSSHSQNDIFYGKGHWNGKMVHTDKLIIIESIKSYKIIISRNISTDSNVVVPVGKWPQYNFTIFQMSFKTIYQVILAKESYNCMFNYKVNFS